MSKIIVGNDARQELLSGVTLIKDAVAVTLGPSGRNVLIRNSSEPRPFSTKDGVTVAGHMTSDNFFEMMAIESIQDVANISDEKAGDGTTTATILAEAIFRKGLKAFDKDFNILDVKKGIDQATQLIIEELVKKAKQVKGDEDMLKQVALVSSNYDEAAADIVLQAYLVAKDQGIVNIKRSRSKKTYVTTIKGMTLPMGYRSKYYVTDHKNDTCVLEKPYVYMTNSKITKLTPNLEYLFQTIASNQGSLLIICQDIDVNISEMLIDNKVKGAIKVCVCKAPAFGDEQIELLHDIGVTLGKLPFIENEGINFEAIPKEELLSHLPQSEEITIGDQISNIKGAIGSQEFLAEVKLKMEARADQLREELEKEKTTYEKGILQMRISRLTDGIAYINIAAVSDSEYIEKQHRIQDALYAIKAASQEGVVPGGGTALLSLSKLELDSMSKNKSKLYGAKIVLEAIRAPFDQILENVGTELKGNQLKKCEDNFEYGYDAQNDKVVKMIESGIMDPVKVTRTALENAAAISGMLLTTECILVDETVYDKSINQAMYNG